MREIIFKRFLGLGFYLKREGENYWLGHQRREGADRIRITKEIYQGLMALRVVSRKAQ